MLRGYFSMAIPVGLTALAAVTWLKYRPLPELPAKVGPALTHVAQFEAPAQDPNAPPRPDEVDRAVPPANRAAPGARPVRQRAGVPQSKDEVRTPMLRNLLDQLDAMNEGTDEEKDSIRQIIYEADLELRDTLGEGKLRNKILAANNRRGATIPARPRVVGRAPQANKGRPAPPATREATPPTTPEERPAPLPAPAPKPAPADPFADDPEPAPSAPPAKDPVDDIFAEPKDE